MTDTETDTLVALKRANKALEFAEDEIRQLHELGLRAIISLRAGFVSGEWAGQIPNNVPAGAKEEQEDAVKLIADFKKAIILRDQ